jgi:inward rectifier potassium channel
MAIRNNKPADDLGFGTRSGTDRNMNKDGSFNVDRVGDPRFRPYEVYHELITMKWSKFIGLILIGYFVANMFFAFLYYIIGTEHLSGMEGVLSESDKFLECFFFSSQTLTTLGYGRLAPVGALASSIAAIESMIGLLGFALATGILYGRFSKPQAKLLFSRCAVVAPYRDGHGLMFRLANQRRNQLIEVEIDVTLTYLEKGATARSFSTIKLERKKINLFPLSWTIVHPIDEESPFYGITKEELLEMKAEIIVLLKAFDDTFSQTVYNRSSYRSDEIEWGRKFLPMFFVGDNGHTKLDLRLIDAMEQVELHQLNQQETRETAAK